MAAAGELVRQDDVAVEQRANLLPDGIVLLVLQKHRVDAGDRAVRVAAGPFEQARQLGKDRWRKAPPRRRLARCQADLAQARTMRVTESISSGTCSPSARKPSATAVAACAIRARSSAGRSDVEAITTERASPSAPRLYAQEPASPGSSTSAPSVS